MNGFHWLNRSRQHVLTTQISQTSIRVSNDFLNMYHDSLLKVTTLSVKKNSRGEKPPFSFIH